MRLLINLALFGLIMWLLAIYVVGPGSEWLVAWIGTNLGVSGLAIFIFLGLTLPWVGYYYVTARDNRGGGRHVQARRPES